MLLLEPGQQLKIILFFKKKQSNKKVQGWGCTVLLIIDTRYIDSVPSFYPPASKASREVANLTLKIYIPPYMVSKNLSVCPSVHLSSIGLGFSCPKLLPFPCYLAGPWRQRWMQWENSTICYKLWPQLSQDWQNRTGWNCLFEMS